MSLYISEKINEVSNDFEESHSKLEMASINNKNAEQSRHSASFIVDHTYSFSCVLLLLFLALLVTLKPTVNESYFFIINNASQVFLAEFLAIVTDMGNGVVAGSFMFILLCFKPEWTLRVLVAAVICTLVTHVLKSYFGAMRPAALIEGINVIGKARYHHSFPSGHTATIFLFAGICFQLSKNITLQFGAVLIAILVGLSRISVGAHWPVDVALGAIIGWLSAYYACLIFSKPLLGFNKQFSALFVIYVLLLVSANLAGDDFSDYPVVQFVEYTYLLLAGVIFYSRFRKREIAMNL